MYIDVLKTGTGLQIYKRKPIRLNNLKNNFLLFFVFFVWYQFFKGQISSEEAFESAPRNRIRRAVILKFEELRQCQFEDKQKRHEQTFKLSHSSIPNLEIVCLFVDLLMQNHHCCFIRPFENHLKKSSSFQNIKGSLNQNLNRSQNQNLKGFQNRDFLPRNGFPDPWEPRAVATGFKNFEGESMVPLPLQENTYLQGRLLNTLPPLPISMSPYPLAPPRS